MKEWFTAAELAEVISCTERRAGFEDALKSGDWWGAATMLAIEMDLMEAEVARLRAAR